MAKETLPGGPGEGKGLHGKMNDVAKTTQGQIVKVAEDDTEKTEGAVFEKINLLSGIDEEKLAELQKADLVLVYRDNNKYEDMSSALENLVENKYGKKVYCVSIPQGTENLNAEELELLKKVLVTCNCMTDRTVSEWTGVKLKYIPEDHEVAEIQNFMLITKSLQQKFLEKGIDKVYIFTSSTYRDWDDKSIIRTSYMMFAHGHICQREDGGIYFFRDRLEKLGDEDRKRYLGDAERFWKNMFPNLDVEFVNIDCANGEDGSKYSKKGSVFFADRHAARVIKGFSGQKIFYAGDSFEPRGGIENFVNEDDYEYIRSAGGIIAGAIMLDLFGDGN